MKNILTILLLFIVGSCSLFADDSQNDSVKTNASIEKQILDKACLAVGLSDDKRREQAFGETVKLINYTDTTTPVAWRYYNIKSTWEVNFDSVDIDICRKCKEEKNKITISYNIKVYFDTETDALLMIVATNLGKKDYIPDKSPFHSPFASLAGMTFKGINPELPKLSFIDIIDISYKAPISASQVIGVYGNYYYKRIDEIRPMWSMTILGVPEFTSGSGAVFDHYRASIDAESGKNYTYYLSYGR